MIKDLCVAIVSIWLFTHAVDFWESTKRKISIPEVPVQQEISRKINTIKREVYPETSTADEVTKVEPTYNNDRLEKLREMENETAKWLILIRGLGECDDTSLDIAASSISQFFGFKTSILRKPRATEREMFSRDSLNADKVLDMINGTQYKTVYVTDYPITTNSQCEVLGYTTYGGTVVVVSSKEGISHTSLHELCHTYGLKHCNDRNCLMYKSYTGVKKDLCSSCVLKMKEVLPTFRE